jgi:hypothetical protein
MDTNGDVGYAVTLKGSSTDATYHGLTAVVELVNLDDEPPPGFTVEPTSGLVTTEAGGADTFTVVLDAAPTALVSLDLSSSDPLEGELAGATDNVLTLNFDSTNWGTPQTVTVTGVDDAIEDGDMGYTIITDPATGAPEYAGINPADVAVTNQDDDGTGDGSYIGDVNGQDGFAAPVLMDLIYTGEPEPGVYLYEGLAYFRAERDGSDRSRVYSVVCDVVDLAGNTSTASCVVVVPHDRRKK